MKRTRPYNPLMIWLLRSPLHRFVSRFIMLLTYTGRKSGTTYTLPVEYFPSKGELASFTMRERSWWKNLLGDHPVTLRLRGADIPCTAEAITSVPEIAAAIGEYLNRHPNRAPYFGVEHKTGDLITLDDLSECAAQRVLIRYHIANPQIWGLKQIP